VSTLSTHVLDSVTGTPAAGLAVSLDGAGPVSTDADGRVRWDTELAAGDHVLTFATGAWFGERPHFHPEVVVAFTATEGHHHVALLLGPYSYTTYKGS
jgi:5-hydroxyisourate hydrolase